MRTLRAKDAAGASPQVREMDALGTQGVGEIAAHIWNPLDFSDLGVLSRKPRQAAARFLGVPFSAA